MAKIDITRIEGYADMTAEQKLAALEAFEMPDPDFSGWVKKDVADKYASEAANFKKQLRERMSEEEAIKAKNAEDLAAIMAELDGLRAEKQIGEYTTQFMGLGYDTALAKSTAEAIQKGDMATMFRNHAKFTADREKALKAEILKGTPTPPAGNGDKGMSRDEFSKLSLADKMKFYEENPERYKEYYGGN